MSSSRSSQRSIGHSSLGVSAPLFKVGDDLDKHGDETRAIVHSYEIHTGTTEDVEADEGFDTFTAESLKYQRGHE
jgi:hypothetical protein